MTTPSASAAHASAGTPALVPTQGPPLPARGVIHASGLALIAILVAATYFLGVRPVQQARADAREASTALVALQAELAAARDDASVRSTRLDAARKKIDSANVRLRSLSALNEQLGRLASLAERHGLSVQQITPAKPTLAHAGGAGVAPPAGAPAQGTEPRGSGAVASGGNGAGGEPFARVPIRLAGTGVYTALLAFMTELHESDPTTRVEGFSLERAKAVAPRETGGGTRAPESAAEAPATFVLELLWHALPAADGQGAAPAAPPR